MKINHLNYVGKKVFVGIDVHKKTYVAVVVCEGQIVKKWRTEAQPEVFGEQLLRFFDGAEIFSAYEAGFSGFGLHRILAPKGITNIVVNPASIEVEAGNKVKTDKRDAKRIAEQLASGRLRGIYIPSLEEEARRSLTRGRQQAVERRTAIGNQLKMKLYYLGFSFEEHATLGEFFFECITELVMAPQHRFAVNELIDAWRSETARIKRFNRELKAQATEDKSEEIYRSAPGVGKISARILSNELGDIKRFDNERQVFSYTGLTPSEYSSGERVRKGHISRHGSTRLRWILTQVAWRAIKEDRGLMTFYQSLLRRRGSKRAIIAVARKMVGRLRHCLQQNIRWQDTKLETISA